MALIIICAALAAVMCFIAGAASAIAVLRLTAREARPTCREEPSVSADPAEPVEPGERIIEKLRPQWENLMRYDGTKRGQVEIEAEKTIAR